MKYHFKKHLVVFLLLSAFAGSSFAKEKKTPEKPVETRELMQQFLAQLTALKKYFVSEEAFTDPKNSVEISSRLKEFANLAKKAGHSPLLNQENFKFSRHVLEEHVVETERLFRLGSKSFARWQLNSTITVCMSCHTQMPSANRAFSEFMSPKMFSSDFDRAEFLFAARSFDNAFELYNKVIDGFPKNSAQPQQVETALERQLSYLSRVKRNPTEAIAKMKEHLKNKELPEILKNNISAWIPQLQAWEKQPTIDPKTSTDSQIIEFAKKNIEPSADGKTFTDTNPNLVNYLRVSGILYEYLFLHPESKAVPEVLYWLSICDRSINSSFFYSLANLYLRECIVKYPSTPTAKKCLKEYETETILGYTGSGGTRVPPEVKEDLKQLKKLIETGGAVELRGN